MIYIQKKLLRDGFRVFLNELVQIARLKRIKWLRKNNLEFRIRHF